MPGRKETYSSEKNILPFLIMLLLGVAAFLTLAVRLYQLQVSQAGQYRALSLANFIDLVRARALRGMIFDRRGRLLADNRPSYNVYFVPAYCRREAFEDTLARLKEFLGLSLEEAELVQEAYTQRRGLERWVAVPVRRDLSWDELAALEQNRDRLEGVDVRTEMQRYYPGGQLAAHLLGYVGEISPDELQVREAEGLRQGDLVGKVGIERFWDKTLRGTDGQERVVVDARRQRVPEATARQIIEQLPPIQEPVPGQNLFLSLDARLQALAEERFPGREGAVVALEPKTGFVLAMLSRPAYEPNVLSGGVSRRFWNVLISDPEKPLTNRATQQQYAPGSTFKTFTALAALRAGAIKTGQKVHCPGYLRFGGRPFRCWRPSGHGLVDLHRALVQSCDVFFYQAGISAGQDRLAATCREFGLGGQLGLDFSQEVPGIIPDIQWYRENTVTGYLPGFILSNSIGQGDIAVTPLQLAAAYAAVANGGVLLRPQAVWRIEDHQGRPVVEFEPKVIRRLEIDAEYLQAVREGLAGVVNEPGGTAYWRRPQRAAFRVAGKTGTAQVVAQGEDRGKDLPYDFRDHALFVGWAPVEDPAILVVVVNEHGGHGSSGAAPLVMEMISYYLEHLEEAKELSW